MKQDLVGQVAIVTGGASGIGKSIGQRLAALGAHVATLDSNSDSATEVTEALIAQGHSATAHPLDVRDPEAVTTVIDSIVAEHGRLDILVNSVGIARRANLADMALDDWQELLDVNLTGVFLCCQAAVRHMQRASRGRVVTISSRGGFVSPPGLSAYAASKAGVTAMSRALAQEVADLGITVNLVAPGLVKTPAAARLHSGSDQSDEAARSEAQRISTLVEIEPEDIAASVAFLCTDDARHITGQTIHVNAGGYMP